MKHLLGHDGQSMEIEQDSNHVNAKAEDFEFSHNPLNIRIDIDSVISE